MTPQDVFELALTFTQQVEGGFVVDQGGPTQRGVTQHTYSAWLKEKGLPDADVRQISAQEIRDVSKDEYWNPARLDDFVTAGCSPAAAISIYDQGFNSGDGRAVKLLQAAVGVDADGIMGPHTIAAARSAQDGGMDLFAAFNARRRAYYNALAAQNPADKKDLHGWLNRVEHIEQFVEEHLNPPLNNGADHA